MPFAFQFERKRNRVGLLGVLLGWLSLVGLSQTPTPLSLASVSDKLTVSQTSCANLDFEREGYIVKSVRVEAAFQFLPWVKRKVERVNVAIAALVVGQPYRQVTAVRQALELIEREQFLPDRGDAPVQFALELVTVENCAAGQLELRYRIYSTQILPSLSGTPEARLTERQRPQEAAGVATDEAPAAVRVRLFPTAGFDTTSQFYGGGRLELTRQQRGKLPFNTFLLEGQGSARLHDFTAALAGSLDSTGWLAQAEWRLNYAHVTRPTGAGSLSGGQLSVQFSGTTRAFAGGNLAARFGGLLEGGNRQGALPNTLLAPDTVASTGYGALKLYAGLTGRLPHQVFSVSYGLALGSVDAAARVDWRKQVGDVSHEYWHAFSDHRILSLESRLSFGGIQVPTRNSLAPGRIPVAERFFGGNNEQFFIPGDHWKIRANPVIRAIPGSRFFQTFQGAGGDRFFSYNLTVAYALWRKPLVPAELLQNADFQAQLKGSLETVTATLQNQYATKDPHYSQLVQQLPAVQAGLNKIKVVVTAAQMAHPIELETAFKDCLRATNTALRRANSAASAKDLEQFGLVQALLNASADQDENWLTKVNAACQLSLNIALGGNAALTQAGTEVEALHATMEQAFSAIDQTKAQAQAQSVMAFPRRTLNTIFKEVNIYSVSPVFVFDVAQLAAARNNVGGVRFGPGVGVRFELASAAHFTLGYAWNVRERPGEGSGTVFFTLGIRNLFH